MVNELSDSGNARKNESVKKKKKGKNPQRLR